MVWPIADSGWVPPSPAARSRRLVAGVVCALVGASTLVVGLGTPTSASPVRAATDAGPPAEAPTTEVQYGPGTMDTSEVTLATEAEATTRRSRPGPGQAGWSTTVELLAGTQMVALSWDGTRSGPDGPASGRVSLRSSQGGTWTGWTQYAPDPSDQGGEGAGRVGSGVVYLGEAGAEAVEVRVDAGPLVDLEVLRLRHHPGEATVVETPRPTNRAAALPAIRPRSAWTTKPYACSGGPQVADSLRYVVVHHTASSNSYTQAGVPGILEGIRAYEVSSLGWCDMAYNFIVDKFGTIWQGRAGDITKPVIGGHAKGFNTGSVGVSLLGQFDAATSSPAPGTPTAVMMDSAARLVAWKLSLAGLDPKGTVSVVSGGSTRYTAGTRVTLPVISYHQQSSLTACPGSRVIGQFPAFRDKVASYMSVVEPPPPTTSWTPFTSVEDLVWQQYVDFRRDPGTYEERRQWAVDLTNGQNRNALVAALMRSPSVDKGSASAIRLYLAYFGRIPESGGIRYWWTRMDGGYGIRSVSADFAYSAEFRSRYGGLTDEAFVRLVYRNVMGREGEAGGIAYWTEQLRLRRESRGGVMVQFSESAEYGARTRDVVEVIHVHEVMLGRAIATDAHMRWVARVHSEGIGALIGTLFGSTEYAQRVG